jgi:YHS domain-containing protein
VATGEFDNMCTESLALGKNINTDCSINTTLKGKTYCFGSEQAKTDFMKDPEGNLAKAKAQAFQKAPRCKAKSKRTGQRCKAPVVQDWNVCLLTSMVPEAEHPRAKLMVRGSVDVKARRQRLSASS